MPVTRKVGTKSVEKSEPKPEVIVSDSVEEEVSSSRASLNRPREKRGCLFCKTKTLPTYLDSNTLRKFVSDRGRIYPRSRSGVCSKHQRILTKQIKYSRHLAIFPFLVRV